MNYQQTYNAMRKFYELGKIEVMIMDHLFQTSIFYGTYSDLAKIIGKDTSNVRKAIIKLESRGIVYIVRKKYDDELTDNDNNPMEACYIVDGWMHILNGDWDCN